MTLNFAQASLPQLYERELVQPLFRPFAELLLDDVKPQPGERMLDVACGSGLLSRLARERLGGNITTVGVDLSPAMLGVAREVAPELDWRQGDAANLPLRDGEQFDIVVCQQGLQFFTDRGAAASAMHRALRPGGRLAVSTWRPDTELPFLLELRRIAERHVGPVDDRRHSLGDAATLESLFKSAGFRDVRVKTVARILHFADGSIFTRLNAMAMVGMSAKGKDLAGEERERVVDTIVSDSAESVARASDAQGLAYDLTTNVLTATK